MRVSVCIVAAIVACSSHGVELVDRAPPPVAPSKIDTADLVVGEFAVRRVVDGDTIRVDGLDSSLRLLGIDTEETFKHDSERRAFEAGWAAYVERAPRRRRRTR